MYDCLRCLSEANLLDKNLQIMNCFYSGYEYVKIINVNFGLRNEYESDLSSNEHYLSCKARTNSGLYGI